jgi:uncharacterized protein (DUF433 family)
VKPPKKKHLGRFIVIDPDVCHGKPTFAGTRIMVEQVLKQVASGKNWDAIVTEWRGSISKEAVGEAVDWRYGVCIARKKLSSPGDSGSRVPIKSAHPPPARGR